MRIIPRTLFVEIEQMLDQFGEAVLLVVAGLFPVINPPAAGFIILSLVRHATPAERAYLARSVSINSLIILLASICGCLRAIVLRHLRSALGIVRAANSAAEPPTSPAPTMTIFGWTHGVPLSRPNTPYVWTGSWDRRRRHLGRAIASKASVTTESACGHVACRPGASPCGAVAPVRTNTRAPRPRLDATYRAT